VALRALASIREIIMPPDSMHFGANSSLIAA